MCTKEVSPMATERIDSALCFSFSELSDYHVAAGLDVTHLLRRVQNSWATVKLEEKVSNALARKT
jgi:hypothetical protein